MIHYREGLWAIMAKFGCLPKFIAIVRQFHDGMNARVQEEGMYSQPFALTNGVKQGRALAPISFIVAFPAMLTELFRSGDIGVDIHYRTETVPS